MFPAHVRHYAAAFMADLSLSAAVTVVPFYIYDVFGGDAKDSGRIMAVQALMYGVCCIALAGMLQNTRRGVIYAGWACIVSGVTAAFMGFTTSMAAFTALFMVSMTVHCFFWPAMQAWLGGERNPHVRARRISVYNLAWCLGLAIGPLFGGPLYDHGGPAAGFLFAGVTAVIAGLITLTLPQQVAPQGGGDADAPAEAVDHEGEMHLYATWCASFMGWLLVGVCRSVLPKRVDDLVASGDLALFGSSAADGAAFQAATSFSWLVFILYATRAGMSLMMGHTVWWRYSYGSLAALQLAAGAAFWLIGYTNDLALMAVAATVVGINGAVSFFASLEYSLANVHKRGSRAAIHEGMVGLGSALGSVVFGYLAGVYGTAWPFLYTPVLIAAAVALQLLLLQRSRARRGRPV